MGIKCPKCDSENTCDSKGNKLLKGVGEFTANFIPVPHKGLEPLKNGVGRILDGYSGTAMA